MDVAWERYAMCESAFSSAERIIVAAGGWLDQGHDTDAEEKNLLPTLKSKPHSIALLPAV